MSKTKTKTKQTAVRLTPELLRRVDKYATGMRARVPGANFTRADAVRTLMTLALVDKQAREAIHTGSDDDESDYGDEFDPEVEATKLFTALGEFFDKWPEDIDHARAIATLKQVTQRLERIDKDHG